MALTATASQGFELVGYTSHKDVLWVPGNVADAVTRGDTLSSTAGEGTLGIAAVDETPIATALKSVTIAATSVALPAPRDFDSASDSSATLIPVHPVCSEGTPVYEVTFDGHNDQTIAAYTAATPSMTLTTSTGTNDDINGGIVYVHAGTGAGQVNVITDYVHGSKVATLLHKFSTALDSTSQVIILEGEGSAGDGIGFFGRCDAEDNNSLDVNDGADDGDWVLYMSWEQSANLLSQLKLRVVRASAFYA